MWEYTSAISAIILVPVFMAFCLKKPLYWSLFKKHFGWHLLASVAYALLHVTIMVALRKLIYLTQDQSYQFGHLLSEFFYEYRKDAATYISIVILTYSYQFIVSRLVGEANLVETEKSDRVKPVASLP